MTLEEQTRAERSRAALDRHARTVRRQRRWYFPLIAVVVIALGVVVGLVWSNSEITHVHLHSAATPAPSIAPGRISATPTLAWRSDEPTAGGTPVWGGTVVTYSAHTVTGRNARTGAVMWTYNRSDRTVCQVIQDQGDTMAFYAQSGDCDELTALDTGTGKRLWVRTIDEDEMTIHGTPQFALVPGTLFVAQDDFIYAIHSAASDSYGGIDRWTYQLPTGCTLGGFAPGAAGVLIAQRCPSGDQLVLRDPLQGADDTNKRITWTVSDPGGTIPVASDRFVASLDPKSGQLITYDPTKGTVTSRTALSPKPSATAPIQSLNLANAEVIGIGPTYYGLDSSGQRLWSQPLSALPTAQPASGDAGPQIADGPILVPSGSGVGQLDALTGRVTTTYPVAGIAAGTRAFALGTGFVLAGASTAVYS